MSNLKNKKTIKVGINGFGRIGRIFTRLWLEDTLENKQTFEIVGINDLLSIEEMIYLLKYDSAHGKLDPRKYAINKDNENGININQHAIQVTHCKNPKEIPWASLGVDVVLESTGFFLTKEAASGHLEAKAKYVIISAPAKEETIPTFVMGVNHEKFNPQSDLIISNASCTTNCLAPLVKILEDNFGIQEALMSTIHALTASQKIVDGPGGKDFCAGRSAFVNIAPASTGAAKAVGLVLPHLKGKITGSSFRVPVVDGSVVDLTVKLKKETTLDQITKVIENVRNDPKNPMMKDIVDICKDPIVSSDILGDTHSCIFDPHASIQLNSQFFKLVAWYDNEMGYSCRLKDLIGYIAEKI